MSFVCFKSLCTTSDKSLSDTSHKTFGKIRYICHEYIIFVIRKLIKYSKILNYLQTDQILLLSYNYWSKI